MSSSYSGCSCSPDIHSRPLHLAIIGGGSAAFAAASKARSLGAYVTIINDRLPIGGCCVNVGCVPSKALLRAADGLYQANHLSRFEGLTGTGKLDDFDALWTQKQKLVEVLRHSKYTNLLERDKGIHYLEGKGKIKDKRSIVVRSSIDNEKTTTITADRILIAAGTRPAIPDIPGLKDGPFLTHESAFELKELPKSILVLGGGYVGVELAQMFARCGSKVAIIQRSAILKSVDGDIVQNLKEHLQAEGIEVYEHTSVQRVEWNSDGVHLHANNQLFWGSHLLIATGRTPNTDNLVEPEGPALSFDSLGFLQVNDHLQTNIEGIFGAGDIIGRNLFVYTAAHEGSVAATNALSGYDLASPDYSLVPWVVFTDPQVAGVGIGEREAYMLARKVDVSVVQLSSVPRALVARETRGLVKLLRDHETKKIVGVQVVASEGSELLMEVSLAIRFGATSSDLAGLLHPYLTLSEAIKMAAIGFDYDLANLSCCSSI